jgi:hypothetical protein
VLNFAEDAHTKNMSTFEADEHLRGCETDPAPTGMPNEQPRSSAKKTKPRSHVVGRKFRDPTSTLIAWKEVQLNTALLV